MTERKLKIIRVLVTEGNEEWVRRSSRMKIYTDLGEHSVNFDEIKVYKTVHGTIKEVLKIETYIEQE